MEPKKMGLSAVPWKDEFGRELIDRNPGPGTLRQQLKKWGTPEEKEVIRRIEVTEHAVKERKRQEAILNGEHDQSGYEKIELVPAFSKHDLKKEW
jgi:hypothetical protein